MQEYNITIFRQSRVVLSLFLLPILFVLTIFISVETHSIIIAILFITIWILLFYYFSLGSLKITIRNDELFFEWKKKFIFNYEPIKSIKINDIKVIVVDNGEFLKKIKTNNNTIYINNSRFNAKDAHNFIEKLVKNNIKVIDSWDEFAEKGYIK
ncbi:hypothetical protein [Chryseobacterium sp. IHB B 17019]|jgi:hypothetical protein|uniref:hypothetical protein n=1 Tax=Chryseobacterium sp. IHB B 17019 TaxID=1721091 RepID=UPI000A77536F|nr:hypothetical protein [Chryseobacterium sp. IHB B 17019]